MKTSEEITKSLVISERKVGPDTAMFCIFSIDGKCYYADIIHKFPLFNTECMIFEINESGEINWNGLYRKTNIDYREKELKNCIKNFIETLYVSNL